MGKHSPGMEGTLFSLVTVVGFQELVGASRLAPQTPLKLSAVAMCPEFLNILHHGHPELERMVAVWQNGGEILDLK